MKHGCRFSLLRALRPHLLNTQISVGSIGRARGSIRFCVLGGWVGCRIGTLIVQFGVVEPAAVGITRRVFLCGCFSNFGSAIALANSTATT